MTTPIAPAGNFEPVRGPDSPYRTVRIRPVLRYRFAVLDRTELRCFARPFGAPYDPEAGRPLPNVGAIAERLCSDLGTRAGGVEKMGPITAT